MCMCVYVCICVYMCVYVCMCVNEVGRESKKDENDNGEVCVSNLSMNEVELKSK